ncbi:hypothetical protein [Glycocaulis sp.]
MARTRAALKIALVGSGAAGAGVMAGLGASGAAVNIDVFDKARPHTGEAVPEGDPRHWQSGAMARVYRRTARENGFSLPLPKSHYGFVPERLPVDGRPRVWQSQFRGGLTNFWGGTMMPLPDSDFARWPVSRADLDPYYAQIAALVGISGEADGLTPLLGTEPSNRPPLQLHPAIARLIAAINSGDKGLRAGVNRIALETRPDAPNACVWCGECLVGCFKGAPFTTASLFTRWHAEGRVARLSDGEVTGIDLKARTLTVRDGEAEETHGPYDRIFIAAGCLGSTRLLMDALGLDEAVMEDSRVVNTPVLDTALRGVTPDRKGGFGLTHGLVLIPEADGSGIAAQTQLYPTLPHFWRSASPAALWGLAGLTGRPLAARLVWARSYLAARGANRYHLRRGADGALAAHMEASDEGKALAAYANQALARALEGSAFQVLGFAASGGGSSSHYGAAKPFRAGDGIVGADFALAEGVYLADSAAWPDVPAMSPTFTIMANAMRIAERAAA